ncbi:MAG: hypothetical protein P8R54_15295 [Myxococcota bacterium]|nr:hypothetical protein [Myxococcota bacterium]
MVELLLLLGAASAAETALTVRSLSAVDLAADRRAEDTLETTTRIAASARGGAETRWFIGVLGEHTLRVGLDTEALLNIRADETGIDAPLGPARIRAGYLVERWGRLDLLPVVDVINGRDLRAGFLTPPQHLRLPAAMTRLQVGGERARAELTWLPVPARDVGSILETDWALIRQGWLPGLATAASSWPGDPLTEAFTQQGVTALGAALANLDPWTTAGLSQISSSAGLQAATGAQSDLLLRLEAEGRGIDGALLGGIMTSRQPALTIDPGLIVYLQEQRLPGITEQEDLLSALSDPITQVTPRTAIAGAEVSGLLGSVGVRAEGLWTGSAAVSRQWFQSTTSPALAAGGGLDWARGVVLLSAEGSWRHLLDAPEDPWLTAETQAQLAGAAMARLFAERMTARLGGIYDLTFSEHMLQVALSWRASDSIELTGGLLALGGNDAPTSLLQAATYTGGPMGYWGDNDCITLEIAFIQ